MKLCPNCKTEYDDDSMFCNKDGTQLVLKEELKCPKCGRVFPMGTAFCSGCGTKLGMTADENAGFCTKCGMKLEAGWTVCPQCNASLVHGNEDLLPEEFDPYTASDEEFKNIVEKGRGDDLCLVPFLLLERKRLQSEIDGSEFDFESEQERLAECLKKFAEYGVFSAQVKLGDFYAVGRGVQQSDRKSFDWYMKALNNPSFKDDALFSGDLLERLGCIYKYGNDYIEKDYDKAFEYYKRACDVKEPNCESFTELADCYYNGYGCEINERKAFKLYKRACDFEDEESVTPRAKARLGECYWCGIGTEVDLYEAVDLFKSSDGEEHLSALSEYYLGLAYYDGLGGCNEDVDLAEAYMKLAALTGSPNAQEWCEEHGIDYEDFEDDD